MAKPKKAKEAQHETINPTEFEEMCHCGHVLDEHEGPAKPCTIDDCLCIAYEEAVD